MSTYVLELPSPVGLDMELAQSAFTSEVDSVLVLCRNFVTESEDVSAPVGLKALMDENTGNP